MGDQPISDLATILMQRELEKNPEQFKIKQERLVDRSEPGMSPHTLATLGGLLDAASTYTFMKRGTHKEANPIIRGLAGNNPELTGLTSLGGLLATKLGTKLVGKKWPKIADAIAANLGAEQLGLGAQNIANTYNLQHAKRSSFGAWDDAIGRNFQMGVIGQHQGRIK